MRVLGRNLGVLAELQRYVGTAQLIVRLLQLLIDISRPDQQIFADGLTGANPHGPLINFILGLIFVIHHHVNAVTVEEVVIRYGIRFHQRRHGPPENHPSGGVVHLIVRPFHHIAGGQHQAVDLVPHFDRHLIGSFQDIFMLQVIQRSPGRREFDVRAALLGLRAEGDDLGPGITVLGRAHRFVVHFAAVQRTGEPSEVSLVETDTVVAPNGRRLVPLDQSIQITLGIGGLIVDLTAVPVDRIVFLRIEVAKDLLTFALRIETGCHEIFAKDLAFQVIGQFPFGVKSLVVAVVLKDRFDVTAG